MLHRLTDTLILTRVKYIAELSMVIREPSEVVVCVYWATALIVTAARSSTRWLRILLQLSWQREQHQE